VQNPLTSLADDRRAGKRSSTSRASRDPGRSFLGGTVITQLGDDAKVAALVTWLRSRRTLANRRTTSQGRPGLSGSGPHSSDSTGFLYLTPEGVAKDFAQDLPAAQTKVMAVTQGPIFAKAFDEKLTNAAWKSKPSWFIVAEKHRMNPARPRARHATKINAKITALPTTMYRCSRAPTMSRRSSWRPPRRSMTQ